MAALNTTEREARDLKSRDTRLSDALGKGNIHTKLHRRIHVSLLLLFEPSEERVAEEQFKAGLSGVQNIWVTRDRKSERVC